MSKKILLTTGIVSLGLGSLLLEGCSSTSSYLPSPVLPSVASRASSSHAEQLWSAPSITRDTQTQPLIPGLLGNTIYRGNTKGLIQALDGKTGTLQWQQKLDNALQGAISAHTDYILVSTQQGNLIALDGNTGKTLWVSPLQHRITGTIQNISEGLLAWSEEGSILLLNKENGKSKWIRSFTSSLSTSGSLLLKSNRSGTAAMGAIFTGTPQGKLAVLDIQTGRSYWENSVMDPYAKTDIDPIIDSTTPPLLQGEYTCATTPQSIACFDKIKGTKAWSRPFGSISGLEGDGLTLYGATPEGRVFALRTQSGKLQWENKSLLGYSLLKPELLTGNVWVALQNTPLLVQLNSETGVNEGSLTLPSPAYWMRALDDRTLLLQTQDGAMYRYYFSSSFFPLSLSDGVPRR